MQNNKISAHPPSKRSLEDFILEAGEKKKDYGTNKLPQKDEKDYPWLDPMVRPDIQKVFTVKLPEEYILKIKFISDQTNKSQQKIIRELICAEIDKLISEGK